VDLPRERTLVRLWQLEHLGGLETMTSGMLLGKFLPPHLGHMYLVEFAARFVDRLTVVVCTLQSEPIPGDLRYRWMSELFPRANVVHLTDELPQDPGDHPEFWHLWRSSLTRVMPGQPDYVFASESYGVKLAETLGAEFIPVDLARAVVPISGSQIRRDPIGHWDYLPRCVRPYFLRRVCVFGPESSGKTTLARQLAASFQTIAVPEYARLLLELKGGVIVPSDIDKIARGQIASEEALARNARGLLFCDTDVLTTKIWSEALYGACPDWIRAEASRRSYDLYLLLDVDVPWIVDPVRYLPGDRQAFFDRCRAELVQENRRYVHISGGWDERWLQARRAVEDLLDRGSRSGPTA
jgi:NadR type nicotinamide-nucleotide adenylyltransferase